MNKCLANLYSEMFLCINMQKCLGGKHFFGGGVHPPFCQFFILFFMGNAIYIIDIKYLWIFVILGLARVLVSPQISCTPVCCAKNGLNHNKTMSSTLPNNKSLYTTGPELCHMASTRLDRLKRNVSAECSPQTHIIRAAADIFINHFEEKVLIIFHDFLWDEQNIDVKSINLSEAPPMRAFHQGLVIA